MLLFMLVIPVFLLPAQAATTSRLPAPGGLRGEPYDNAYLGGVRLDWDPVGSATNPAVAAYRLYRAEQPEGQFVAIADLSCADEVNYLGYFDAGLAYDTVYYYRVAALDCRGTEGDVSATLAITSSEAKAGSALANTRSLIISLADQRVYFLENGRIVNILRCSSGAVPGSTPCGNFSILYHVDAMPISYAPGTVCYYWLGFAPGYGIHAWPNNGGYYYNLDALGTPQSHGCVRLHPDEAPWAYAWTPNGTPLTIIAQSFMPLPPPIDDGTVSIGATAPSKSWYFAEGYTGGQFTEYILVQNPDSVTANVHTTFMTSDRRQVTHDLQVPPTSRATITVDNLPGLASAEVSATLSSDIGIIAERAMYFDYNGIPGGHDSLGATATSATWYLAEGYTGAGFDEYVLVQNPNTWGVIAALTFMKKDGTTVTRTMDLAAQSRGTIHLNEVPELQNQEVSTQVTCGDGVIAERSMYFNFGGITGGHNTLGSPRTSKNWYFAEGCTDYGFQEFILVQNPGATSTNVTLTFMKTDGTTVVRDYPIPGNSRFTVPVNNEPGCGTTSLSAQVSSTEPVVAERAMYWMMGDGRRGGHDHIGSVQPALTWYFAEGYTAGSFDEYILLQNPGGTAADVWITYMVANGSPVGYAYSVAPHQRVTVHVDEVPGLEASEVSAVVYSNNSVPIAAERAMYFCIPRERQF